MRPYSLLFTIAVGLTATAAFAHGPTPKKVSQTIEIKADPKDVWAIAKDFSGISKWDSEVKESTGDAKKRTLTFQNGQKVDEEADSVDDKGMTYSYRMGEANPKALPVSSYTATFTVSPASGGSKVEWSGRFYRADTGNEPAEGMDDAAAQAALEKYFKAGLEGLKAKAEKKS